MLEAWSNSVRIEGAIMVCLALVIGVFGACKLYRTYHKVGAREIAAFTYCYLALLLGGPTALGWRYPEITIAAMLAVSAMYIPILTALSLRCFSNKAVKHR